MSNVVIVGGVIEQNGKFLLVQEAKEKCYGKWNIPAGHLDPGETLFDGAKREIKEETNCDVELTGLYQIDNDPSKDGIYFVFATKLLTTEVKHQADELLDAKWFTYEEILAMYDDLRAPAWIMRAIEKARRNQVAPLELINIIID